MTELDEKEVLIAKELVRNPRVSDLEISRKTKIPVNTVNRKRRELEAREIVNYYTYVDQTSSGTGKFGAMQYYRLKMKLGLTQEKYLEEVARSKVDTRDYCHNVLFSLMGEIDGHLTLMYVLEGADNAEITRFFNTRIVKDLQSNLGEDAITEVITMRITGIRRVMHNYLPYENKQGSKLIDSWPDEFIEV